jgi:hypothetical protein
MVQPLFRVFGAGALAGAVMIGAVLVDSSREKTAPARPDAVSASSIPARTMTPHRDAAPSAPVTAPLAETATRGPTDEEITALMEANPELRASIEELLNDPDPMVRKEGAELVLELAAATAEISR